VAVGFPEDLGFGIDMKPTKRAKRIKEKRKINPSF
jgi:hypothetical protein